MLPSRSLAARLDPLVMLRSRQRRGTDLVCLSRNVPERPGFRPSFFFRQCWNPCYATTKNMLSLHFLFSLYFHYLHFARTACTAWIEQYWYIVLTWRYFLLCIFTERSYNRSDMWGCRKRGWPRQDQSAARVAGWLHNIYIYRVISNSVCRIFFLLDDTFVFLFFKYLNGHSWLRRLGSLVR